MKYNETWKEKEEIIDSELNAQVKGKKDPVKKNMDKFHKPKTHRDKTKYNRKDKSKKLD